MASGTIKFVYIYVLTKYFARKYSIVSAVVKQKLAVNFR